MAKTAHALSAPKSGTQSVALPGAGIYVELNFQQAWTTEARWVRLVPAPDGQDRSSAGATYNRGLDGRIFIILSREELVAQLNSSGLKVALDINHATELKAPQGEEAPAQGWFSEFRLAEDAGIEGLLTLNALGLKELSGLNYRYLSPALSIRYSNAGMEVTGITSVALTNKPNLLVGALNHQTSSTNVEETPMDKTALLTKLGLKPDASQADIDARLDVALNSQQAYEQVCIKLAAPASDLPTVLRKLDVQLNAQATAAPGMVPKADYDVLLGRVTQLEAAAASSKDTARKAKAEGLLTVALNSQKIAPSSVEYHRKAMATDEGVAAFEAMIAGAAPLLGTPEGVELNMQGGSKVRLSPTELAMCEQMGIKPEDFAKTKQQSTQA